MDDSLLLHTIPHPHTHRLTLNRSDKRNALSIELMSALLAKLDEIELNQEARVLILMANGPAFCSGLDLHEVANPELEEESSLLLNTIFVRMSSSQLVTIAAVQGAVLAGGLGLLSVCDIVVAADNLRWGFPEVRRGVVPALITPLLMRQIPWRVFRRMVLTGETAGGKEALEAGIASCLVEAEKLQEEAFSIAEQVLLGGPESIRLAKQMVNLMDETSQLQLEKALEIHHRMRLSPEAEEGTAAFLEKRSPSWIS